MSRLDLRDGDEVLILGQWVKIDAWKADAWENAPFIDKVQRAGRIVASIETGDSPANFVAPPVIVPHHPRFASED